MELRTISLRTNSEDGNVFIAIFGAIALVGLLGASIMTFMKGPLSTSVRLTKINTAESQMSLGAQVAVMATASQANSGDCEAAPDGYVEPIEWRAATTEPYPTGGGLVPLSLGISKKDPWGTEYGYCGWNHGGTTSGSGCGANMLAGTNSRIYPVVAIISAGPDKTFTTTCRDFATADVNSDGDLLDATDLPLYSKAAETDDDIITSFTYEEATGASGGLWNLKAGDPTTATINKKIEATGVADLRGGVLLPDKALIDCNDVANSGVMAKSAGGIEICDGAGTWTTIGGGGASGALDTASACAAPSDAGNIRYNTVSGLPEFCDGTQWRPFTLNSDSPNLVVTPTQQNAMNVDGSTNQDTTTCSVASGYYCGNEYTFTLQNQGGSDSAAITTSLTNSTNFVITSDTCNGNTLAVMASCVVTVRPKANGNTTYTGNLQFTANNNPFAIMQGTSTNFGCVPGRTAPGGVYVGCSVSDPDGTYDLVINPSGCSGVTSNPVCSGADTAAINRNYGGYGVVIPNVGFYSNQSWGARQHQNIIAYSAGSSTAYPAAQYCDDLDYQGQTDWFLPSYKEWEYVRTAHAAGSVTMDAQWYMLSDHSPNYYYGYYNILMWYYGSGYNYYDYNQNHSIKVRCVRREGLAMPSAQTDTDPDAVGISPAVVYVAGAQGTSNTVTVAGVVQTITATITAGNGANIVKNGVSTGSTSVSGLKVGDTLAFEMNAPAVVGTKNTATITIGSDTYSWWVGYADNTRTVKVFVATDSSGNLGGVSGADSICETAAAASSYGLSGGWKAILSSSSVNAIDRIPWNWGTAQTVTGTTIVDGGIVDMFDGSLDSTLNVKADGTTYNGYVHTGSSAYGVSYSGTRTTAVGWCNDWTSSTYYSVYATVGNSASSGQAFYYTSGEGSCSQAYGVYCMEDIDSTTDTTPATLSVPYLIQVPVSARQSSQAMIISGMSPSATATLSVTATGGDPKFTVNGGAETASASVQNGDSVIFKMDSPAGASSSYKMTITANGTTTLGYWRVWTGDPTGAVVKRVFVTSSTSTTSNKGGLVGFDAECQTRANAAALGGTWKVIASGGGTAENEWAVNHIGYNWTTLRRIDGVDVVLAGNIWSTDTTPLLNPISVDQNGATLSTSAVRTGTTSTGMAAVQTANGQCNGFTLDWSSSSAHYLYNGTSGSTASTWINNGAANPPSTSDTCHYYYFGYMYCIEQ